MHYYEQNIGDYRKDTGHLTLLEHGIYRALLDTYYLDEKPLTLEHAKLMRSHCVRTADEVQAFENVLQDFFERTENGYTHKRCDEVIAAYREKGKKAKASADARWAKEREQAAYEAAQNSCEADANALQTHSDGNANHKPLTSNHKPVKAEKPQRGSRLPKTWQPSDEDVDFCETERPDLDIGRTAAEFRDYWTAKAGKDSAKTDWPATWRNWIRRQDVRALRGPAKTSELCWWVSDQMIIAKGNTLGMQARPGESIHDFKGRIQAALSGEKPAVVSRAPAVVNPQSRNFKPDDVDLRAKLRPQPKSPQGDDGIAA